MYPKTHLHLNSKQSGQIIAVLVGVSLAQYAIEQYRLSKKSNVHKFDNVLIKEDPKTGLVTVLTVHKGGKATQYSWTHKK